MSFAGRDRTNHNLAGVHTYARLERQIACLAQSRRVACQLLLHTQRCVQRALRMILMRDGRAEQRKDAIAG